MTNRADLFRLADSAGSSPGVLYAQGGASRPANLYDRRT